MGNRELKIDSLLPPEMAEKAEDVGVAKSHMDSLTLFLLAVLAGAFIGLGADLCTITATNNGLEFGLSKLVCGLVFCIGLILVIVAGAELFTGNNLILMATISKKVSISKLLRNWGIVYVGNFIGSIATAYLIFQTKQYLMADGAVGAKAIAIATAKCDPSLGFSVFFFRAIMCNALVCLAVWLCFSARTSTDKILCILFPITAFVACGFEHCVANMYFIPMGIFVKNAMQPDLVSNLTWLNFFKVNLLPVTIGNVWGGSGFVAITYWLIYRRKHTWT